MIDTKLAVMYGGGSIGRGFLGQLFNMSEYRTCFVDVDKNLVNELKDKEEYDIKIATPEGYETQTINNITAVNGMDADAVSKYISTCSIMATAVGVNILPLIAKTLAAGLDQRCENSAKPLDIIVCENMSDGGTYLKDLVLKHTANSKYIEESIGFVSASVGRMVPVSDSSDIIVESFNELPIDKDALRTDVSDIRNFVPISPFAIEKYKKYFMHNMSHAIVAYLGFVHGYEFLWQAMEDDSITQIAKNALSESIEAISKYFNADKKALEDYAADLLFRYKNKYLGDTIKRVGRDPVRKLGENDRLAGAAFFCIKNSISPEYILYGIAAAMCFDVSEDISSRTLQNYLSENGMKATLTHFSNIDAESAIIDKVISIYNNLRTL